MRFAILPLVIHRESQFVPAGNDARRVIESTGCGWVVDSGDSVGTAAAIREARADAAGLAMRGRMARARFDAEFSLDICARRFEQRLLALVSAPASDCLVTSGTRH